MILAIQSGVMRRPPVNGAAGVAGLGAYSSGRGLGVFQAYVNGDLQTFSDNPCAPGLQFINGGCFRAPGTQDTPYGTVAIPLAGPAENLSTAAGILGGGATCRTERVDAGPYVYEQNICRDAAGNIIAGADVVAEAAYAARNLQTLGQQLSQPAAGTKPSASTIRAAGTLHGEMHAYNTVSPAPPPAASTPRPPATPVQTATPGAPVGGGAVGANGAPVTAVQTADVDTRPNWLLGGINSGNAPYIYLAAGVAVLFLLPKLTGGR